MKKWRIHELAKELKTNSKRLIEKLNEINIYPKGPMSYLDEEELKALKKHLGIQDEPQQEKEVEKKPVITRKRDSSKPYTIIKRVVNIVDDGKPEKEEKKPQKRTVESSSGLRPGFVVVQDTTYETLAARAAASGKKKAAEAKAEPKVEPKAEPKAEPKTGAKAEPKKDELVSKAAETAAEKSEESVVVKAEKKAAKKTSKEEAKEFDKKAAKTIEKEAEKVAERELAKEAEKEPVKEPVVAAEKADEKIVAEKTAAEKAAPEETPAAKVPEEKKAAEEKPELELTAESKKEDQEQPDKTLEKAPAAKEEAVPAAREEKSRGKVKEKAREKAPAASMDDYTGSEKEKGKSGKKKQYGKKWDDSAEAFEKPAKKEGGKGHLSAEKGRRFRPEKFIGSGIDYDELDDHESIVKKPKKDKKKAVQNKQAEQQAVQQPPKPVVTKITIPEVLTVKELAEALKKTSAEVIKKLLMMGVVATVNQEIDFATAEIVADEFGVKAELYTEVSEEELLFEDYDVKNDPEAEPRPPVVVVMGHVDHGKTSLLDAIRKTNVTMAEAGGITQHIGAYMVKINNRYITFLDTPGHEAFTTMRARGAQVTDIAILVVAADDGVMPQTVEAINHAKAANVSIIVAINKIDKPSANPERVKQQLTEYGLVAEEWGGDVIMVPVSAKTKENLDTMLEMVLLTADMLELKANPRRQAKGTVIEAKLDKNRGPVATLLVQQGTLRVGDSIVTGTTVGRIRAMMDDVGRQIKEATPSMPVEILGLPDVPEAGEIFHAVKDEKLAKQLAEKRKEKLREEQMKKKSKISLDDLFNQIQAGNVKELNIIVKADVVGSVEAIKQALLKLSNDEVKINIIHDAVGAVTESDVSLAEVSNAIIIGFNVRPNANTISAAEEAGVDLRLYTVIYDAIEDIKAAMQGMLEPTYKEVILGHAEVRQTFKVSSIGTIAGCYVTDGKITRNAEVRLIRDGIIIHQGKIASLKRFKDDVREVAQNYECGITIEKFNDIKENDIIEAFIMEEVKRS